MTANAAGDRSPARVRGSDLPARIASSVVLAALALFGLLVGGWVVATLLAIALAIVHLEWANLTDGSPLPTAVFTAGLVIAMAMATLGLTSGALIIVGLAIAGAALTISVWRPIGVAYASVLGLGLLLLRLSPDDAGFRAVLVVLAVVWASDTGAYFVGRAIGGAKLWPAVSPNKTWAGAIGGLVIGVAVGVAVAAFVDTPINPALVAVAAGLAIAAQAGDLFESWVKRRFGAKDSSRLVPGHGGLMDRVDGLVFATGFALVVGWLHGGPNLAGGLIGW